jgi:hypothetical protein
LTAGRVDRIVRVHPAAVAERGRQQRDLVELTAAEASQAMTAAEASQAMSGAVAQVRARALDQPITLDWPTELAD